MVDTERWSLVCRLQVARDLICSDQGAVPAKHVTMLVQLAVDCANTGGDSLQLADLIDFVTELLYLKPDHGACLCVAALPSIVPWQCLGSRLLVLPCRCLGSPRCVSVCLQYLLR